MRGNKEAMDGFARLTRGDFPGRVLFSENVRHGAQQKDQAKQQRGEG
jgi:hypothetical protein